MTIRLRDFSRPDARGREQDVHAQSVCESCSQHAQLAAVEVDGGAVHPGGMRSDTRNVIRSADVLDLAVADEAHLLDEPLAHRVLASPVAATSARMRFHCRSVSTRLGWMQLTCTPSVLPMSARHLVKAATAALTELPMVNSASGFLAAGAADRDERAALRPSAAARPRAPAARGRRTSARSRPPSRRRSARRSCRAGWRRRC